MKLALTRLSMLALFGLVFSAGNCSSTPRRTVEKSCLEDPNQAKCLSDSSTLTYCEQYPEDEACDVTPPNPDACTPPTGEAPKVEVDSGGTRNTTVILAKALCPFGCVELRLSQGTKVYKPSLKDISTTDNDSAPCCPYKTSGGDKKKFTWSYKLTYKEKVDDPNNPGNTIIQDSELPGGTYSAQFFYRVKTSPDDPNYDANCNGQGSFAGEEATAPTSISIPEP